MEKENGKIKEILSGSSIANMKIIVNMKPPKD